MDMYAHVYKVFLHEPLTLYAHLLQMLYDESMRSLAYNIYYESMRSQASNIFMNICAPMHNIFYYENMRSLASNIFMKVCAHMHHIFYYESMRSLASNVLLWNYALTRIKYLLWKYALPHTSYVSLRKYVLACMLCFLTDMKGFLINMQPGVCQRFSCQTGGSGASQFIFDSIAVTYIVCSFSLSSRLFVIN
jgi:hypothetical protein